MFKWIMDHISLVIATATGAVHTVEALAGLATGVEKAADAKAIVVNFVNQEAGFQPGVLETDVDALVGGIVDGIVWFLNKEGVFKHATTTQPTGATATGSTDPATGQPTTTAAEATKASNAVVAADFKLNETPVSGNAAGAGASSAAAPTPPAPPAVTANE